VIDGVEGQLQHPALLAEYIRAYREERMRDAADAIRDRASLERRANEVKGQLSRLLDAYLKSVITIEAFEERSAPLNAERDDLAQRLAQTPRAPVIELHPQAVAEYERIASDLAGRLGALDLTEDRDTIDKFRSLIDRVVIHDTAEGGVEAEVIGRMSAVLGLPAGDVGGLMVAEEGFEPPTRGL